MRAGTAWKLVLAFSALSASPAAAQRHHHPSAPADSMPHEHDSMPHEHGSMPGMFGPYPYAREASGTAWQPDLAMHRGVHETKGPWTVMLHGMADVVADDQGGPRGAEKVFSSNMLMGRAQRPLGPGRLGLRTMLSLEPATIGKKGYPLLLQTGETADGRNRLIDRQHPHDLFMELAASYSVSSENRAAFVYAGLPGEPALGPPVFMHRFTGMAIPASPIAHHWLDSSHITYGVLTAGAVVGPAKLEASAFRGREPDENRYGIESAKLDSHSFRASWNPAPAWALQASYGRLKSPEQLEPRVDVDRTTASVIYATDRPAGHWETTLAWGRNRNRPGRTLDAFDLESAARLGARHNVFVRIERVEKDELFPEGDPRDGRIFHVSQASAGYRFDFWTRGHVALGVGALGSVSLVPRSIESAYGGDPASGLIFTHAELR